MKKSTWGLLCTTLDIFVAFFPAYTCHTIIQVVLQFLTAVKCDSFVSFLVLEKNVKAFSKPVLGKLKGVKTNVETLPTM